MQLFKQVPTYDIIGQRRFWVTLSVVLNVAVLSYPAFGKLNWGVDFAGGTEIQVQFASTVDVSEVRKVVEGAGFTDANIQEFGDPKEHEYLVRVGRASLFKDAEFASHVEPKIRANLPGLAPGAAGVEYKEVEGDHVTVTSQGEGLTNEGVRKAFEASGLHIQDVRAITEGRQYSVIFRGVSDKVEGVLDAKFAAQKPVIRRVEQVGAAVGAELKWSALKALVFAILLILAYVAVRFDFTFGVGAIVSLIHDALIVVGAYFIGGFELNTNTIAVTLTIIGYSVNDTVIIYDRIRENLTKHKGRDLEKLINESINETLSRSIITHFTTLLSVMGLMIFTVGTLREFSMAMAVGVITGTYSSVFIASPIVIWMTAYMKNRKATAKGRTATAGA